MNLTTDETGQPVFLLSLANATHHLEGTTAESASTATMGTTAKRRESRDVGILPGCRNERKIAT